MDWVSNAAVGINVINSADGKDSSSGIFGFIQQGFAERLGGIVAAAGGAGEFSCFSPIKGRAMTRPMR